VTDTPGSPGNRVCLGDPKDALDPRDRASSQLVDHCKYLGTEPNEAGNAAPGDRLGRSVKVTW